MGDGFGSGARVRALTVLLAIGAVAMTAVAQASSPAPLSIQTSSLVQNGQQLVWSVTLQTPFSPGRLARAKQGLCLLIEHPSGVVRGEACVEGPARHSSTPRLTYTPTGGRTGVIVAAIARASVRELSATFLPSAVGQGYRSFHWQTETLAECSSSEGCKPVSQSRPALVKLHTPQLVGCVAAGPSLVYNGPADHREVALTFDDGPWYEPPPPAFVDLLKRYHATGTFFEIGDQISRYDPTGAYERAMLSDGDMIGDHSWSHPDVAALPVSQQRAQLLDAAAAIRRATHGFTPCLWRPPYGDISKSLISLARSLGFLTIMWDVDPRDWALPGVTAIYTNVIDNARDGAIVIQHFGGGPRYETIAALPHEIDALRARGYRFVTITQLLGLRLIYR
jgi:peptidoglycan-N-acetylglucosamine deacetylase